MLNGGQMSPGACSALDPVVHYHAYISRAVLGQRGWDCVLFPSGAANRLLPCFVLSRLFLLLLLLVLLLIPRLTPLPMNVPFQ